MKSQLSFPRPACHNRCRLLLEERLLAHRQRRTLRPTGRSIREHQRVWATRATSTGPASFRSAGLRTGMLRRNALATGVTPLASTFLSDLAPAQWRIIEEHFGAES